MTNPVSQIPSAQLPLYGQQIVDPETGTPTMDMHRFMLGLYDRTGGAQGASASDAQTVAQAALTTAEGALSSAGVAQSTATAAETAAAAAQATANGAQTQAVAAYNLASSVQATAMTGAHNLSEITSKTTSRSNLGLNTAALNFSFDAITASLKRGLPILQNLTLPANFAGSIAWTGVAPTGDVTANISVYRAGSSIAIGSVIFVHGTGYSFSYQPSFSLLAGDVVVVQWPVSPDATLAQVAITLATSMT